MAEEKEKKWLLSFSLSEEKKRMKEELERAYGLCSDLGLVAKTLFENGENGIKQFKIEVFMPIRPALAERLPSAEEIIKKISRYFFFCQIKIKSVIWIKIIKMN
jgi:DNA ligase-1